MTLANQGPAASDADPDVDTITNLLEYAQDGNPNSSASAPSPVVSVAAGNFEFRFQRIADPALTYEVWRSPDLSAWGSAPIWTSTGAHYVAGPVIMTEPLTAGSGRFFRLRVTGP